MLDRNGGLTAPVKKRAALRKGDLSGGDWKWKWFSEAAEQQLA